MNIDEILAALAKGAIDAYYDGDTAIVLWQDGDEFLLRVGSQDFDDDNASDATITWRGDWPNRYDTLDEARREFARERAAAEGYQRWEGTIAPIELQARREALGFSQQTLAIVLGVKQPTVSAWENGTRRIPDGVAADLDVLEERLDALTERMVTAATTMHDAGQWPTLIVHPGNGFLSGPVHDTPGPVLPAVMQRVAAARARQELLSDGIDVRIVAADH